MARLYVPYAGPIVRRDDAKAAGLSRFFTGKPCKHGHLGQRTTCNGACIWCNQIATLALYHGEAIEDRAKRNEKTNARIAALSPARREERRAYGRLYAKTNPHKHRAWKAANPESIKEYGRKYRAAHPNYHKDYYRAHVDQMKRKAKEWYLENKKRAATASRRRYNANPVEMMARSAAYNRANPATVRAIKLRYKALLAGAQGSHTGAELQALFTKQGGKCVYCDTPLTKSHHADHIQPLSKGGTNWISNIQLLCKPCNVRKSATDPDEYARRIGLQPQEYTP